MANYEFINSHIKHYLIPTCEQTAEYFFAEQLYFLFVCCTFFRWKPTWIFFFASVVLFLASFWTLMEKKSIIISKKNLAILISKQTVPTKEGCNQRACLVSCHQAKKSGENCYSFSIPLWFALRHHFFLGKTMSYVILENDRLCRFLTKKIPKNFMMPN